MSKIAKDIQYSPVGVIHSPHKDIKGMPIQPSGAKGIKGTVEVKKKCADGLKDLGGFEYIILIYHFHRSKGYSLEVKPFLDNSLRGVFATRAPKRPNAIGMSIVRLLRVEGNILHIEDVDILDGTPLLDIKPYVPDFDARKTRAIGWLSRKAVRAIKKKADGRFR
ncbi:MAG TPA: tRNA (N6-threonylcarbamoyladenosine(37)-N6)-methyltransferase TrmO [Nitrospiraceae bacterium]|jgi:tRNA-Thr(GGU) m(6)t(6)A37 methyltransferase TsaA|nr:tRNA (N6-threonylcarbamoyladenosine(37)-N6)-methyltransferase TrmO [Nitrospiraceae bacterium]